MPANNILDIAMPVSAACKFVTGAESLLTRQRRRHSPSSREELGAVYTPPYLAAWAASLTAAHLDKRMGTIVDPACGDGALLAALSALGVSGLTGIDCDPHAINSARKRGIRARLNLADGLAALTELWIDRSTKVDAVITNPPWGAHIGTPMQRLLELGYSHYRGQMDSWNLFLEGSIRCLRPGGILTAILPDSLFQQQHELARRLLLSQTRIRLIARLGEGHFPGVYRGAVVLVARKGKPTTNHQVQCSRLPASVAIKTACGELDLHSAVQERAHLVRQRRFDLDPHARFDIDVRVEDAYAIESIEQHTFDWDRWVTSGRGIEISKSGRVILCPICDTARPVSNKPVLIMCASCGKDIDAGSSTVVQIVRVKTGGDRAWQPLIIGADVDRGRCSPSREVLLGVKGIRYKSLGVDDGHKLLIRKTGVGIKAAVDQSGAATNQVVFHYCRKPNGPPDLLDYLEGILCSRVLLAWHLARNGESEWRSHPYISQTMIKGFPVPKPSNRQEVAQAIAIAKLVRQRRKSKLRFQHIDYQIEQLVAHQYGLSKAAFRWAIGVLNNAQGLEPIRSLREFPLSLAVPRRATRVRKLTSRDLTWLD